MTRFLQGAAVVVSLIFAGAAFTADAPALGAPAPAFKLQDQTGKWHSLSDCKGKWVVLYIYPKDNEHGLPFPILADLKQLISRAAPVKAS